MVTEQTFKTKNKRAVLVNTGVVKKGTFRQDKPYLLTIDQDMGYEAPDFRQTYSKRFRTKAEAMTIINDSLQLTPTKKTRTKRTTIRK